MRGLSFGEPVAISVLQGLKKEIASLSLAMTIKLVLIASPP